MVSAPRSRSQAARGPEKDGVAKGTQPVTKSDASKDKLQPGSWAKHLRDGTELCLKWNHGSCTGGCKRLHACCRVMKSGRVCGMKNHSGKNCKNAPSK